MIVRSGRASMGEPARFSRDRPGRRTGDERTARRAMGAHAPLGTARDARPDRVGRAVRAAGPSRLRLARRVVLVGDGSRRHARGEGARTPLLRGQHGEVRAAPPDPPASDGAVGVQPRPPDRPDARELLPAPPRPRRRDETKGDRPRLRRGNPRRRARVVRAALPVGRPPEPPRDGRPRLDVPRRRCSRGSRSPTCSPRCAARYEIRARILADFRGEPDLRPGRSSRSAGPGTTSLAPSRSRRRRSHRSHLPRRASGRDRPGNATR